MLFCDKFHRTPFQSLLLILPFETMSCAGPSASVSWCKFECVIASPDKVKVMTEQPHPPPLVGGGAGEGPSLVHPICACCVVVVCLGCCQCQHQDSRQPKDKHQ